MFGFYRLAAAVPQLRCGDVVYNLAQLQTLYRRAAELGAAAVVFPELSITGYTCGDLFQQERLQRRALEAALTLAETTAGSGTVAIFGLPVVCREALFNTAAIAQGGKIRGLVPKSYLPNYREFYEKRQFTSGFQLAETEFQLEGRTVPFGLDLLFEAAGTPFCFGVEICEDLWSVLPPSSTLALRGARLLFNLSASPELATKAAYRRELVRQQSARTLSAYVLAAAGVHESTSDVVFGGQALIADNGRLLAENQRFQRRNDLIAADVDLQRLGALRRSESSFLEAVPLAAIAVRQIPLGPVPAAPDITRAYNPPRPFVPADSADRHQRCREILAIQAAGLAGRLEHTAAAGLVVGVSGGLDSTLAVLVAVESCRLLGKPADTVLGVTLPGFGSTGRTHDNAVKLCRYLGTAFREIDIRAACRQHFADLGHDPECHNVVYENVQARERTQILMDLANQTGGLVVGTGDLSEIALGWNTYNGDHMSMYAVNCSIPKTLIRYLIETVAQEAPPDLAAVLDDIIATPVSPELLPPSAAGTIQQETEKLIGPYELHDFFLYHFLKYGAEPDKIAYLARQAWHGRYPAEFIEATLRTFLKRFFRQQFKRNCMPDGPKVGSIALSPRGDWRMPSEAMANLWLE